MQRLDSFQNFRKCSIRNFSEKRQFFHGSRFFLKIHLCGILENLRDKNFKWGRGDISIFVTPLKNLSQRKGSTCRKCPSPRYAFGTVLLFQDIFPTKLAILSFLTDWPLEWLVACNSGSFQSCDAKLESVLITVWSTVFRLFSKGAMTPRQPSLLRAVKGFRVMASEITTILRQP